MIALLLIIALFLDGYLSTIIPLNSLLLPLLTVTTLHLIYPYFNKNKEKFYYMLAFITGIIYDLLYTNLLLFNAFVFLFIAKITKHIYINYQQSIIKTLLYLLFIIIVYEFVSASIFFVFQITTVTMAKIIYKIVHSLLLNVIYAIFASLFIKKIT